MEFWAKGATQDGSAAMLSEGLFCDAFALGVQNIMAESDANSLNIDYESIEEIIKRYGE